jgi:hypothetical protein
MINWKTEGTRIYQQLPERCFSSLRPALPERIKAEKGWWNEPKDPSYSPWKTDQKK